MVGRGVCKVWNAASRDSAALTSEDNVVGGRFVVLFLFKIILLPSLPVGSGGSFGEGAGVRLIRLINQVLVPKIFFLKNFLNLPNIRLAFAFENFLG